MADDTPQDVLQQLLDFEAQVTSFLAQLSQHHTEMRQLDYDADAKLLRPFLDTWMDWHLAASYWVVLAKQQRSVAKTRFREAWAETILNTRQIDLDSRLAYSGSFEERQVVYQIKTDDVRRTLDVLDRVVDTVYDFIRTLKTTLDHWNARRVDTKWEMDRMSRLPGGDYTN